MSRGPGRVQRAILAYLEEHKVADVRSIASAVESMPPQEIPPRIINSYFRAMSALAAAGHVEFAWDTKPYCWPTRSETRYGRTITRAVRLEKYRLSGGRLDKSPHTQRLNELAEREARITRAMGGQP